MKRSSLRCSSFLLVLGISLGGLTGCNLNELLNVDLPSQIERSDAEAPARAISLVEGGIALYNCALTLHIQAGGLLGDEFKDTGFSPTDARNVSLGSSTPGGRCSSLYQAVSQARWVNDHVYQLLDGWTDAEVPDRSVLLATTSAYAGFTLLLMGEGFCTMAIDGGPEMQSTAVFALAEERFTRALAAASGSEAAQHLARVGRARARHRLGQWAAALSDARAVPAGFAATVRFPATTQANRNPFYNLHWGGDNRYPVDLLYQDVRFAGVPDPRVRVINRGIVNFVGDTIWAAVKFDAPAAPIELATWEEAQLIAAEAELNAGNVAAAVAAINALHTKVGLPAFESADPAVVLQQIIAERRAELFLEGQHLGDYRQYELPFVPAPGTPYPGRPDIYGDARCYPLPLSERDNNPNF